MIYGRPAGAVEDAADAIGSGSRCVVPHRPTSSRPDGVPAAVPPEYIPCHTHCFIRVMGDALRHLDRLRSVILVRTVIAGEGLPR